MNGFKPSKYQLAILEWALKGKGNGIVNAVPGSGKTTTLVWLTGFIRGLLAFFSFCRSIVLTLSKRCPNATCKTYNALGFAAIREALRGKWIKLHDGKKVPDKSYCILWEMFPKDSNGDRPKDYFFYKDFVKRLVGLAKNEGIGCLVPDTTEEWRKLAAYHNLELRHNGATEERGIEIARDVLRTSNEWSKQGKLDFDDQKYLVCLWDLKLKQFDWLLVDEFQDSNRIERDMIRRMMHNTTRLLMVGDDKQSIYGFRGADVNAMAKGRDQFNATELKLSINYRCSKAVIARANLIFPEVGMEACEDAPDGKVEDLEECHTKDFRSTDAVICRNVKPLVSLAYQLIRDGIACHILGREIGEGLITIVEKLDASTIDELGERLDEYQLRETEKLSVKGRADMAESVNDQCDCIKLFLANLKESNRTIEALCEAIRHLFSNDGETLTLSTIHKAKGMEFERVFILDFHLIPSKYATEEWQLAQEKNLQWVALTRAKLEEYFITSEGVTTSNRPIKSDNAQASEVSSPSWDTDSMA